MAAMCSASPIAKSDEDRPRQYVRNSANKFALRTKWIRGIFSSDFASLMPASALRPCLHDPRTRPTGGRHMDASQLQRLCDREEIAFVLHEYCRALDAMDLDAVAALFCEDCVVEYGPEERLQSHGRAAIRKALERLWRWKRTSHHLSNIQISFCDGEEADARSYVIAWHERPDGTTATVFGQYEDRLRREAKGWRLARRRQMMNGNDRGFTVNLFKAPRREPPPGWVAPDIDHPIPKSKVAETSR
jgi:ketosteroid isomerase-like protein